MQIYRMIGCDHTGTDPFLKVTLINMGIRIGGDLEWACGVVGKVLKCLL